MKNQVLETTCFTGEREERPRHIVHGLVADATIVAAVCGKGGQVALRVAVEGRLTKYIACASLGRSNTPDGTWAVHRVPTYKFERAFGTLMNPELYSVVGSALRILNSEAKVTREAGVILRTLLDDKKCARFCADAEKERKKIMATRKVAGKGAGVVESKLDPVQGKAAKAAAAKAAKATAAKATTAKGKGTATASAPKATTGRVGRAPAFPPTAKINKLEKETGAREGTKRDLLLREIMNSKTVGEALERTVEFKGEDVAVSSLDLRFAVEQGLVEIK